MFKSIKKRLKNQRGLTLVELLAVVVILGIIAAIAVPNIGKLIGKTEDDAKVAEGIQIINAAKLYVNSEVPTFGDDAEDSGTATTNTAYLDSTQLADYLDNVQFTTYVIKVVKANNGKYSYFLKTHDSISLVDSTDTDTLASEDELLDY
jgi:type IV pilus assembly protein PilA